MCGISGIINFKNENDEFYLKTLIKINKDLTHRGPDNSEIWKDIKRNIYLGHTRLSIIDLDKRAHQPMFDQERKYVISFNGEIYNYLEIKEDFKKKGIKFKTQSDTEIFLLGYKLYGSKILDYLDGMFAVAIYDLEKEKLFIARDRSGEKPLYYISNNIFFSFCSELKPLLNFNKNTKLEIDNRSVFSYLALRYVPYDKTIIKQIKKLEPGCFLELSNNNNLKITRYFAYNINPEEYLDQKKFLQSEEILFHLLKVSIKKRLNADVPLGAFLSGGVDSSLTSAIITKEFNRNLNTFSIGFENSYKSEHLTAKKISNHINSSHNEIIINKDMFINCLNGIGDIMDEPNGDRSLIPTYIVSKFAKEKVTVALSGDGADELFGGYPRYWELRNHILKNKINYKYDKYLPTYLEYMLPVFKFSSLKKNFSIYAKEFLENSSRHFTSDRSIASSLRNFDYETYMTCVLSKVDIMSMRNSLEVRTPFLDPAIINFSKSIPDASIYNGNYTKLILRKICSKYIPQNICLMPKKGFGLPINFYLNKIINNDLIKQSKDIYSKSNFFQKENTIFNFMNKNFKNNTNSFWSYFILAQWINSLKINL